MHVPLVSAKTLPFNSMYLLHPTTFDFCYVTKPVRFIETKPINRRALNSCTLQYIAAGIIGETASCARSMRKRTREFKKNHHREMLNLDADPNANKNAVTLTPIPVTPAPPSSIRE